MLIPVSTVDARPRDVRVTPIVTAGGLAGWCVSVLRSADLRGHEGRGGRSVL